jgi:uncharacterized membrane protein
MTWGIRLLALIFGFAGLMHFIVPSVFDAIVPPWLPSWMPSARTLVYVSGVAEIAGAIGLLLPQTRVLAAWCLIALLIAVFPANVQMLLDARARDASAWWVLALWLRLPMQPLLIWFVWRSAIRTS